MRMKPRASATNEPIVLGGLLAAERHALEALELTNELLDAGTSPIECSRERKSGRFLARLDL